MSDIFREVEEDVRRDQLEKFWKQNGTYFIILAVLVIAGAGGWQLWQRYEQRQREQDSTAFIAAQHIRDPKAAAQAFADLSKTAHGGYVVLSKLGQANNLLGAGKRDEALAIYKDVAASESGPIGAVARIRAGWVMADTAPRADLQALLQPLLEPTSAWRQMAQEILAYSDYRSGKALAASGEFNTLAADPEAPDALRQRARAFAAFLAAGGATSFGTVPPPPPATVPGTPPTGTPPDIQAGAAAP